jgi:nicotinate-nucleotide adenylyltransferase
MIGVLGGTFNPVHFGHLRMAIEAFEKYQLEQIRFIPCKVPVHKKTPGVSAEHRVAMLKLAIQSQKNFIIDEREVKRKTPSYMIETLSNLRDEMPKQQFGLILGSTELILLTKWRRWQDILKIAQLIVLPRDTASALPISSTAIRNLIKKNKNPQYLLPNAVLDYIVNHKLYKQNFK